MKKLLLLVVGIMFFTNYVFSQNLTVCGNRVDLTAEVEGYTDFSWFCDNAEGTFSDEHSPNTLFTLASSAEYGNVSFHYTAIVGGDLVSGTIVVCFIEQPKAVLNMNVADTVACGLTFEFLRAETSENAMAGYWYEDNVTTQFGMGGIGAFNPVTDVTVSSYGRHDFYWIVYSGTEENPRLCVDTAGPWTINFIPRPSAQISNEQINFCGVVDGQLHVDFNGEGEGRWSSSVTSNVLWFDDPTDPNTGIHTAVYNSDNPAVPYYTIYWRVQNTELCADEDSVRVSFARAPLDSIIVVLPVCFGGPAMLTAYEDSLPLYNWDYGNGLLDSVVTNSMGGEYRIFVHWEDRLDIHAVEYTIVNSWGCQSNNRTINIEEPNVGKIEASIAVSADIDLNNLVAPDVHVLFVNTTNYGGTANAVCEWHFGDESVEDNCDELVEHVYNAPDCYEPYLVVMNSDVPQCRDTARLDNCLSIAGIADFNVTDIDIYPSPVTDLLNITSSETISSIEIVNVMGQVVLQMDVNADNAVCNVEELANGVYVVRIRHFDKVSERIVQQKFVKE